MSTCHDIAVGAGVEPSEVLSYLVHIELCKAIGRGGAAPSLSQAKRQRIATAVAAARSRA